MESARLCSKEAFQGPESISNWAFHHSRTRLSYNWLFIYFIVATQAFPWISENNILTFGIPELITISILCTLAFTRPHSSSRHPRTQTHTFPYVYIASFVWLCRGLYQNSEICYNCEYLAWSTGSPQGIHDSLNSCIIISIVFTSEKKTVKWNSYWDTIDKKK